MDGWIYGLISLEVCYSSVQRAATEKADIDSAFWYGIFALVMMKSSISFMDWITAERLNGERSDCGVAASVAFSVTCLLSVITAIIVSLTTCYGVDSPCKLDEIMESNLGY